MDKHEYYAISETVLFQGSPTISLKCGGICNDHFVENFVLSLAVKDF